MDVVTGGNVLDDAEVGRGIGLPPRPGHTIPPEPAIACEA